MIAMMCGADRVRMPLAAALGLALALGGAAAAQQPVVESSEHGAWIVGCIDAGRETVRCEMVQRVVGDGGEGQILAASILAARGAPPSAIIFTTPLGVWLEPGALLAIPSSDTALALAYERCAPNGCMARAALDDELRGRLAAGDLAELRFSDRLKRTLAVPIVLEGFADGLAKLEAETGLAGSGRSGNAERRGVWGWLRRVGG
jgi:invasion protein IalB